MGSFGEFILLFIQQFAGGPGPPENNLVRFGLAAFLWLALLVIAWSRQRSQSLPRERLLVMGFGLALARELVMFALITGSIVGWKFLDSDNVYHHPLEHALLMAAIIVVAGAYLRYSLDDERISRRYLQVGIGTTAVAVAVVLITWPRYAVAYPGIQFHHTWQAWVFHIPLSVVIAWAIYILAQKRGWLRNVVILAMSFFFISEFIILVNFATQHSYSRIICPIGNSLHILAIPLLGFVYLKEQSIEKRKAEEELATYHDQLENLVEERTAKLTTVNAQLQEEIRERQRVEVEITQRNAGLAALNAIAATISQSLELETILNTALGMTLSVLEIEVGAIFLLNQETKELAIRAFRGDLPLDQLSETIQTKYSCIGISWEAVTQNKAIQKDVSGCSKHELTAYILNQGLKTIVSTPLLSKAVSVGALTLGSTKTDLIKLSELNLLKAIGQQIGVAVENARLFQELERYTEGLSLLHEVSITLASTLEPDKIRDEITRQGAKLLGCQMAYILYGDQERQTCEIVSSYGIDVDIRQELIANAKDCQLLESLLQSRQTIAISDTRSDGRIPPYWIENLDIRTVVCLPLWVNNEPIEFLFLLDRNGPRNWRTEELKLVEAFVNRAAVALENANLHKQMEWAAALQERQRIAADMHDGLAQVISLLGLKVDHSVDLVPSGSNGELLEALKDIRETVNQASIEARKSISSLQTTPRPRKSLQDILTALVEQWSTEWSDGNDFVFNTSFSFSEPLVLPPDHITQVVPIIQEAIINALKHSDATQIQIQGQQLYGQLIITIQDDGKGFDVDALTGKEDGHFGLKTMRARAARFGGELQITSKPDDGTIVTLSWELDQEGKKNGLSRHPVHPKSPAIESETYA
jgi:signal transduction histidine kinase